MNVKQISDGELLQSVKGDDTNAFEILYDRYWKALYIKACQRVDRDEAKDIVQEVMMSLWRRRKVISANKDGELAGYLFTAVKYRVISHYAFNTAEIKKTELFDELDYQADILETKELKAIIEAAVSRLPVRMQQIFRMSREEDHSIADIAQLLNLSEQTVKNQLTEALKRLRTSLQSNTPGDWALVLLYIFCQVHK